MYDCSPFRIALNAVYRPESGRLVPIVIVFPFTPVVRLPGHAEGSTIGFAVVPPPGVGPPVVLELFERPLPPQPAATSARVTTTAIAEDLCAGRRWRREKTSRSIMAIVPFSRRSGCRRGSASAERQPTPRGAPEPSCAADEAVGHHVHQHDQRDAEDRRRQHRLARV